MSQRSHWFSCKKYYNLTLASRPGPGRNGLATLFTSTLCAAAEMKRSAFSINTL